jgi:hypothetical protein
MEIAHRYISYDVVSQVIGPFLNGSPYLDTILYWKPMFRGHSDSHLEHTQETIRNSLESFVNATGKLERTEVVRSEQTGICSRYMLRIGQHEIAKNLRIESLDKVRSVSIIGGGCIIETVYAEIFPILRKMYGMSDNEIPLFLFRDGFPFVAHQNINVVVEYDDLPENHCVRYDIYRNSFVDNHERLIFQVQKNTNVLQLGHPVIALIVDTEYEGTIRLKLSARRIDVFQFRENGKTIIALAQSTSLDSAIQHGFNFSCIPDAWLVNEDETPFEFTVYAISMNVLLKSAGTVINKYAM